MKEAVKKFIKAHRLLTKGATVIVGTSGGPDSIALLHLLYELRNEWSLTLYALTIDHGLREQAKDDVAFVERFCEKHEIPLIVRSVQVASYKEKKRVSTQVAARRVRYAAFEQCMSQFDQPLLALGHHGDDQVETLLLQLMRTSDSSALLGMPITRSFANGTIIRPLLSVTKAMIVDYCKENQLDYVIDETNEQSVYMRNAIRKDVMPLLKSQNHRIHETAQKLSENLQIDEAYLQGEAQKLVQRAVIFSKKPRSATIQNELFCHNSVALQRRAYHLILNYLYEDEVSDLSHVHEALFFSLLDRNMKNKAIEFPRGLIVSRSYQTILFRFSEDVSSIKEFVAQLPIPGKVVLPNGGTIHSVIGEVETQSKNTYTLRVSNDLLPLMIRTVEQGDVMRWDGLNGSKKVRRIFIDRKVPVHLRKTWPLVVTAKNDVLWLIGLQKGKPLGNKDGGQVITLSFEN